MTVLVDLREQAEQGRASLRTPDSSTPMGTTAICQIWRVCQHLFPPSPILLLRQVQRLLEHPGQGIKRRRSRSAAQVSHLPVGIR